jgi:hypothetical protein
VSLNYSIYKRTALVNILKNFLIVLSISILSLAITTSNNAEAKMFNKFKKGFYFEKYKTAEEAKAELLKLHPIGSDVEGLVRTLEGAGAIFAKRISKDDALPDKENKKYFYKAVKNIVEPNHYKYTSVKVPNSTYFLSIFELNTGKLNPLLWKVFVWYDKNKNLTEIDVVKNYMGL